jgi:hypothetical protein
MTTATVNFKNHRKLSLYANGVITIDVAINDVRMAIAGMSLATGFGQSLEDFLSKNPQSMDRFKMLTALLGYLMTRPSVEEVKQFIQ